MDGVSKYKQYNSSEAQIQPENPPHIIHQISLMKIAIVASVGTAIQFGWALQFSLLTPYFQLLGIPHRWISFIWLCGPISGMIVQPIIGYQSDKCNSQWGRRRPFIALGSFLFLVAVILISFAADFGSLLGDPMGSSDIKLKGMIIFLVGFWVFDMANFTLQGPVRAFLADLAGTDQQRVRNVFALYCFFLAVGSVLGYAAGSFPRIYKCIPLTKTIACDADCANLKTCFLISALLLLIFTASALTFVQDKPVGRPITVTTNEGEEKLNTTLYKSKVEIIKALHDIPRSVWILVLVTCLNWLALCVFLLYNTDWMGKEVYGGEVRKGTKYGSGVRAGALGLMLNSLVVGCTSLGIEFLVRKVGGVRRLWGCSNFFLALCLGSTVLITKLAEASRNGSDGGKETHNTPWGIRLSALTLFAVLGVPLGVTISIPSALASIFSNSHGAGQGLTGGILNLGIVIPQIIVSITSGPWDDLFGGGNLPSFVVGAFAAAASGIVVLMLLPSPSLDIETESSSLC